jgi:excinuclease ABC subunit C
VATSFHFDHALDFTPAQADEILRTIPALPGVFALCGARKEDAPYLTQTTDLRRRMRRLLDPPESQSKRLNLREKVERIEYCVTGSTFESSLVLYQATAAHFGYTEARRRLKLHTPYFLRMTLENPQPRVYSTNKLSKRGLAQMYGPFPSRLAAERYCDAVLDLFKLRRCYEDLAPHPDHPGCVYGEMNKCLEPCKQACTQEQYAAETAAVKKFFDTRGESLVIDIGLEREVASSAMHF